MTFREEIEQVLDNTVNTITYSEVFDQGSKGLAFTLAGLIREAMDWEDPENDSAIHNAVAEEINIFVSELTLDTTLSVPAHYYLINQVTELLRERNEQIYFNDIMEASNDAR